MKNVLIFAFVALAAIAQVFADDWETFAQRSSTYVIRNLLLLQPT
jgi:hypothetical protein